MDHSSRDAIPLGDLLQKTATRCYQDLQALLEAMPQQTPLIRAEKLEELLQRKRRRLTQLLSILLWLQADHVRNFLKSTSALQGVVKEESSRLNMKLDTLYYMLMGQQTQFISPLLSKRVRPIESVAAAHILSSGKYPFLPEAIFNPSAVPGLVPALSQAENNENAKQSYALTSDNIDNIENNNCIRKELEICIRSKIFLECPIPKCFEKLTFNSNTGMLVLSCEDLFEVTLSLVDLDAKAPWEISNFHFLVKSHDEEDLEVDFLLDNIEGDVFSILVDLLKESNGNLDGKVEHPETETLHQLYHVCQHSSLSISLRLLYVQGLAFVRENFYRLTDIMFRETYTYQIIILRLWPFDASDALKGRRGTKRKHLSSTSENKTEEYQEYHYEVLVFLSRSPKSSIRSVLRPHDVLEHSNFDNPSNIDVDLLDDELFAQQSKGSNDMEVDKSNKFPMALNTFPLLKGGVRFSYLWNSVLKNCANDRLHFLQSVLMASPVTLRALDMVNCFIKQFICFVLLLTTIWTGSGGSFV